MQYFLPQYAARAVADLERSAKRLDDEYKTYRDSMLSVASLIRSAVQIVLPTNAEIYRDNGEYGDGHCPTEEECLSFTGIPAPICCLQYSWIKPVKTEASGPFLTCAAPKRLTLVLDDKQIMEIPENQHGSAFIASIFYSEENKIWMLSPLAVSVQQPLDAVRGIPSKGYWDWAVRALYIDFVTGTFLDTEDKIKSHAQQAWELRPDISALVQTCHALRAGALLDEKSEQSSSRRRKFNKMGVGGFAYHVLRVPDHHDGIDAEMGTHASPRFHIRRAHIRKLPSGALTFVRQCFVGNPDSGVVDKHYKVAVNG